MTPYKAFISLIVILSICLLLNNALAEKILSMPKPTDIPSSPWLNEDGNLYYPDNTPEINEHEMYLDPGQDELLRGYTGYHNTVDINNGTCAIDVIKKEEYFLGETTVKTKIIDPNDIDIFTTITRKYQSFPDNVIRLLNFSRTTDHRNKEGNTLQNKEESFKVSTGRVDPKKKYQGNIESEIETTYYNQGNFKSRCRIVLKRKYISDPKTIQHPHGNLESIFLMIESLWKIGKPKFIIRMMQSYFPDSGKLERMTRSRSIPETSIYIVETYIFKKGLPGQEDIDRLVFYREEIFDQSSGTEAIITSHGEWGKNPYK